MARRRRILLNGPTSGLTSFALVNRRLAEELARTGYEVWAGDDPPLVDLHKLPDVCLTHGHPYDALNAPGRVNVFFLEYDYARFLRVDRLLKDGLDARFDLCAVPSRFVRDACRASGVTIPIVVCPLGVDFDEFHPAITPAPLPTCKRFTFVYVGGATERKGIDVLVDAFRAEFTAADDATLVLKTHGYDHLLPWFEEILGREEGGPEIVHVRGGVRRGLLHGRRRRRLSLSRRGVRPAGARMSRLGNSGHRDARRRAGGLLHAGECGVRSGTKKDVGRQELSRARRRAPAAADARRVRAKGRAARP